MRLRLHRPELLRRLDWWLDDLLDKLRPRGWFAWRPVKLDTGEWVWLEMVECEVKHELLPYRNYFGGKSFHISTTVTYHSLTNGQRRINAMSFYIPWVLGCFALAYLVWITH